MEPDLLDSIRGMKGDKGAPGTGGVNPGRLGVKGDLRILFTPVPYTPSLLLASLWTPVMPRRVSRMDPETLGKMEMETQPGDS